MRGFSFFMRMTRGSGEIRGVQMAKKLDGRVNPESDYEDDTCIFILGTLPNGIEPTHSYYDPIDCGLARIARIRRYGHGPIIAVSKVQREELAKAFPKREVYMIPQQHCNFNRERREKRPVRVAGCIGGDSAIQWPHYAINRLFKESGLEWKFGYRYGSRQATIDFYKTIDIQISYRPLHPRGLINHMNVLKLSNAGSFGIPTVSYPEPAYAMEWKDECLFNDSIYGIVKEAKRLADNPSLYEEYSEKALNKSEEYHIDNISKLYLGLP